MEQTTAVPILLLVFLVAFGHWLYAERRQAVSARVIAGIGCMVLIGFTCYWLGQIIPRYDSSFHRRSMLLTGEMLSKGETQRVRQAVQTYNNIATNGSTYHASMEMLHALNHRQTE